MDGFGLSDGEQLERLWSFLRRFGKMTKEMRPSHRIDVLSDAILHYARNCENNLGNSYTYIFSILPGLCSGWKLKRDVVSPPTARYEILPAEFHASIMRTG